MPRPARCRAHAGFTLAEVLIVALLIAVLMGILLPALAQVRAVARRAQCASRLRQIGIAVVDYGSRFRVMPTANQNLVSQLQPIFGQVNPTTNEVTDVWRCPVDEFVPEAAHDLAISYAPTENDTAPDALLNCPWSLRYQTRMIWRPPDTVAPDTVVLVEYWCPGNRANADSDTIPGWVRRTLAWTGDPCPKTIPPTGGTDVGGYLFLRGFDAQAEGTGRPRRISRILHIGAINVARVDGSIGGPSLREVTGTRPADYPIWTREAD